MFDKVNRPSYVSLWGAIELTMLKVILPKDIKNWWLLNELRVLIQLENLLIE